MTRLVCNGVALDLYDNAGLQFTHDNPLFAFDKLSCERTTQFKLPSTPTNDRVLSLARVPAYSGTGMRRRFSAQLQSGTTTKDGYVYVSAYDGKDYNAIFVTGELVGLQAIKDAGKIRDILQYDQTFLWDDSAPIRADAALLPSIGIVNYLHANSISHLNPSVSFRWLLEEAAAQIGTTIDFPHAASADRQRLFAAVEKYKLDAIKVHILNDPNAGQDPVNMGSFLGLVQYVGVVAAKWSVQAYMDAGGLEWDFDNATLVGQDQFNQISLPYDCVLEFPEDMPQNLCIVSGNILGYVNQGQLRATGDIRFLGSRVFYGNIDAQGSVGYAGDPLAGQRVTIPANTPFMLSDGAGLVYPQPQTIGEVGVVEFNPQYVPAYDIEAKITINHEWVYGENVPYNAFLPDLTLIDVLRIYAGIQGAVLGYEDEQIIFDTLDFNTYASAYLTKLTKRGEVTRTFADYAQTNLVRFESDDNVLTGERLRTAYFIDNDNLDAEKDLSVLKASEGGETAATQGDEVLSVLYIRALGGKALTIADASLSYEYMLRVSLPKNNGLQTLCDKSTQFKVEARTTMSEYNAIRARMLVVVDGTPYVWTSRSWQGNVAKFTLAKTL